MPGSGGQKLTPWQYMRGYETQLAKIENNWRILHRKKERDSSDGGACMCPVVSYYNNGKTNACCKDSYDYNFSYCAGYDQSLHRDDRKHQHHYMHIDLEEEYPCRAVPLLTNSKYGHRPSIDPMKPIAQKKVLHTFYRNNGLAHCLDANKSQPMKLNPAWAFRYNAQFGYTYRPPTN